MGKLAFLLGLVALFGCDDNRNVAVSNTNPQGTVGGIVLDLEGEMPIAGATVTLESAGTALMAMTDASGVYTFAKVPAGDFFLTIAAPNYESAYVPGTLSGAVGNFPVSNPQATVPTVELFKTSGTFAVSLVDDRGAPVAGVTVTARVQVKYYAYNYPYGGGSTFPTLSPFGQYAVTATSDGSGVATFSGLPADYAFNLLGSNATEMFVDVPPILVSGTTTYQFAGASFEVNPTRVIPPGGIPSGVPVSTYTLQLVGPNAALQVAYSSIDFLVGGVARAVGSVLPTDKPITVTFNQAINQQTLRAQLLDENGATIGNLTAAFAAGNIVSLTPAAAFGAGKRYNLVLHAEPLSQAAGATNSYNRVAPFFTAGPSALTVKATLTPITVSTPPYPLGKVVVLDFSEAVGLGNGAPSIVLPCVAWYESIDLDNSGTVSYQGEYATALQKCPDSSTPLVFDMTKVNSFEPTAASMPVTGFATRWWVQVDDTNAAADTGGCKSTVAAPCTKPVAGTMVHLLFSHLAAQTMTRADGQVVSDLAVAIQ